MVEKSTIWALFKIIEPNLFAFSISSFKKEITSSIDFFLHFLQFSHYLLKDMERVVQIQLQFFPSSFWPNHYHIQTVPHAVHAVYEPHHFLEGVGNTLNLTIGKIL